MKFVSVFLLGMLFPVLSLWAQTPSIEELSNLQRQSMKVNDFQAAVQQGEKLLQRYTSTKTAPDTLYFRALLNCARARTNLGLYQPALANYTEIQKLFGGQAQQFPLLYAETLNAWGALHNNANEGDKAKAKWLEARDLLLKTVGKNNMVYAKNAEVLSLCYFEQECNLEKTEAALIEAKDIIEQLDNTKEDAYAFVLSRLAGVYRSFALHNQAEAYYIQGLSILEKNNGKNNVYYALMLNDAAFNYMLENKLSKAENAYQTALATMEAIVGKKSPLYFTVLSGLGQFYARSKRYAEAETTLTQALEGQRQTSISNLFVFSLAQDALARVYIQTGRLAQAETLLLQNQKAAYAMFGKESALYAMQLKNLILLHTVKKEYDKALAYAMQALDADSKDIDSTATFTDEFIKKLPDNNYYCNEIYMMLIDNLNTLLLAPYRDNKDEKWLPKAYLLHQSIFKFLQRIRDQNIVVEDKMTLIQENARIIESAIQTALKVKGTNSEALQTIFGIMEQNKMLLLGDALKSRKAQHFGYLPKEMADKEELLQTKIDATRKALRDAPKAAQKDSLQAVLNERNLEMKQFQAQLQKDYPEYFRYKYAASIAQASNVQKSLSPKTALIEYFVADTAVYALRMTQKDIQFFAIPLARKDLESKIAEMRRALSDYDFIRSAPYEEVYNLYTQTGTWFYDHLLSEVLKGTQDIQELVIVADGNLGNIPFETFLTEQSPAKTPYTQLPYLLKKYSISYSYSATLLAENMEMTRKNNGQVLAMAASYSKTNAVQQPLASRSASLRNLRAALTDLPSAQQEVESLKKQFSGKFLFNDQATEAQFKQLATQYSIVHLAMHGILETSQPVLSSLAFTENGDTTEDNFLQAWEISHLRLNADLVVLSACETGYGKFQQGEGIMSLARAFMYAGAPSLVISLWAVNDQSTAEIMDLFYKELEQGKDKATALRNAKLAYLQRKEGISAHPAFWAPFVQLGDSKAIVVPQNGGMMIWLMAGAGLLLFGAIGMVLAKRMKK